MDTNLRPTANCFSSRRRVTSFLSAAVGALLVAGCATSYHGLTSAEGSGMSRSFEGSADNAWRACILTMEELGLEFEELDPGRRFVLASTGMSTFSYGEFVGCFVRDDTLEGRQLIELVSQRRMATTVFAKDWTEDALWTVGVSLARLEAAEAGPWLQPSDLDLCLDAALEEGRKANLEISSEEQQRCRKDAGGSSEKEAACLAERTRIREGWIVHADPEALGTCLAERRQQREAGRG